MIMFVMLSAGTLIGAAAGWAAAYPIARREGVDAGIAMARQGDAAYVGAARDSGYDRLIPHGLAGHTCSTMCPHPPRTPGR